MPVLPTARTSQSSRRPRSEMPSRALISSPPGADRPRWSPASAEAASSLIMAASCAAVERGADRQIGLHGIGLVVLVGHHIEESLAQDRGRLGRHGGRADQRQAEIVGPHHQREQRTLARRQNVTHQRQAGQARLGLQDRDHDPVRDQVLPARERIRHREDGIDLALLQRHQHARGRHIAEHDLDRHAEARPASAAPWRSGWCWRASRRSRSAAQT